MALTLAKIDQVRQGNMAVWYGTATFDSSYLTGGESLTPANLGLDQIYWMGLTPDALTTTEAVIPLWDKSANKIQLVWNGGAVSSELDEITSTTNVSALVIHIRAEGPVGNLAVTATA